MDKVNKALFFKKINKAIYLLFIFVFLISLSPAHALDAAKKEANLAINPLYEKNIQDIMRRGVLRIAMYYDDVPPFFMVNKKKELIGMDVELGKALASELGVTAEFNREAKTYDEVVERVAAGKADIGISNLSYTIERSKKVIYTNNYSRLNSSLMINRFSMSAVIRNRPAATFEQLLNHQDATIMALTGSSFIANVKEIFPKAKLIEVNKRDQELMGDVLKGKALAYFDDSLTIRKNMDMNPSANLKILPLILSEKEDPMHIIVNPDLDHLHLWINQYLKNKKIMISLNDMFNKYSDYFKTIGK